MKVNKQFQNSSLILTITWFIVVVLILSGCSSGVAAEVAAPPTQTSVQLSWLPTIEFVGFYEATRQGYYAEENLEVRVDAGGFDESGTYIDPVQRVVNGETDFGVIAADLILSARAQGQPIVAVANIYQRSPVVLISLGEKNIARPQDLIGRRIATKPNTSVDIVYNALLTSQNIDHADLIESPTTDFTVNPLFNDETDVLLGFITNEGVQTQVRSDNVNFILPSDYGIDIYSSVIFTTEDMVQNKPDLVEAFVRATVRGLQWAVDNPTEAADYVVEQYGKDMPSDVVTTQHLGLQASLPLLNPAGSRPGLMTAENWEAAHQILLEEGILKEPLDIEAIYNLTFLEKAYAQ